MPNAQAEAFKAEGNNFFKNGKYEEAAAQYVKATALDSTVPAYWSNMSASYEKLGKWEEALAAGQSCITADNKFVKGYFRLATAQKALNNLDACIRTLESGLGVSSSNNDLKRMKKEVTELRRADQVATFCGKAEELMQGGDIAGAFKILTEASKKDAGNADIERMMAKVKPKWEAMEKKRVSGLSSTERLKNDGDDRYKAADFEGAIEKYSQCLATLGETASELAIKALSNRSACYKQISNFTGTIEDCSSVLEHQPDNIKSLVRRAQAFEAMERYRFALQDVKHVLTMPYNDVGQANFQICNQLQHRLNAHIKQMKAM